MGVVIGSCMPSNSPKKQKMSEHDCKMKHGCTCKIGPSLLACNLARMGEEASRVVEAGADYLHLDVMDGCFVPNISWGPPVIKSLRKEITNAFFDVHMMVAAPEKWVQDIKDAGGDQFTFHLESTNDPAALIQMIRDADMKVGMAIKPGTSVEACKQFVASVDMVLVMTVEPGFGGQSFMPSMMPKVRELRDEYPDLDIEVDGGLGPSTIEEAASAGANMIVAGSSVFKPNPGAVITIALLRQTVEKCGNGLEDAKCTVLPEAAQAHVAAQMNASM